MEDPPGEFHGLVLGRDYHVFVTENEAELRKSQARAKQDFACSSMKFSAPESGDFYTSAVKEVMLSFRQEGENRGLEGEAHEDCHHLEEETNLHDTILLKVTMLSILLEDAQMTSGLLAEENAKLSAKLDEKHMTIKYWVDENEGLQKELEEARTTRLQLEERVNELKTILWDCG